MLEALAKKIEQAEPTAHCQIDKWNYQIIVSFDKRPDTEVALLTPYAKKQIKEGKLDTDTYTDLLFSVKKIANWSVA